MYQQGPQPQQPITTTIVQVVPEKPREEIGMVDVAVASFGLTGVIMAAAVIAGLLAGPAVHLVSVTPRDHDHRRTRRA